MALFLLRSVQATLRFLSYGFYARDSFPRVTLSPRFLIRRFIFFDNVGRTDFAPCLRASAFGSRFPLSSGTSLAILISCFSPDSFSPFVLFFPRCLITLRQSCLPSFCGWPGSPFFHPPARARAHVFQAFKVGSSAPFASPPLFFVTPRAPASRFFLPFSSNTFF